MIRPIAKYSLLHNMSKQWVKQKHRSPLVPAEPFFHTTCPHEEIYEINGEEDFKKRVMRNSTPVIVNFHADWCEPCHALKPLLIKIVEDNPGKVHLAEIVVDDHADLLQTFEVTAVPAVLAVYRGQVTDKFIGLVSDKQVREFVDRLLAGYRPSGT